MSKFSTRLFVPMVAAALLAACGGDKSNADSALASDTSMARDLALAQRDTAAQPQLTDVPATTPTKSTSTPTKAKTTGTKTAPSTPRPAPARTGTIAAGTQLSVRANSELCTNTGKIGDKFTATVNESVVGSNGATIPAGATVTLTITKLSRSENVNDPIEMEFSVDEVSFGGKTHSIAGSTVSSLPVDKVRNQPKSKDVQKVVGGAAIGAIAGQVLGKNTKSTVIGAAAGAAAGAATAAATANYEGCVRAGRTFVVTLGSALSIAV
ncbi:MAG: hypothetical protein ACRENU_00620 [Gemmatimonadaceae bacterium]